MHAVRLRPAAQARARRRGTIVLVVLACVVVLGAAPAQAGPVGYYDVSPSAGSTTNDTRLSFSAQLALLPDIHKSPTIDWGDGTSHDVDPDCKLYDGRWVHPRDCSVQLGDWSIPAGTLWLRSAHTYKVAGSYTATLTYTSLGVPYKVSWKVNSPGAGGVPLQLAYDPNKLEVSLDPAPLANKGLLTHSITPGTRTHVYEYPRASQVTVTATPKPGYEVGTWEHVVCDVRCRYGGDGTERIPIGTPGATTLTVTTVRDVPVGEYDDLKDPGTKSISIGAKPGNRVTNGSFETPDIPAGSWQHLTSIPGWSSDRVVEVQSYAPAAHGGQYVELDSDAPTRLWQDVPTTPGASYEVSYFLAARPGTTRADGAAVVSWGGKALRYVYADGSAHRTNSWGRFTNTVTAGPGTTTQLRFEDLGTANGLGLYVDDVVVRQLD